VSIFTASTKLIDLKRILADDQFFGPIEAPVGRQRIFHLGRELKSGGRSLCNLGLGRFNNRIIHLCIRPALEETGGGEGKGVGVGVAPGQERGSADAVGGRKRRRVEGAPGGEVDETGSIPFSVPLQAAFSPFSFMHQNSAEQPSGLNVQGEGINSAIHTSNTSTAAPMDSMDTATNHSTATNNSAIDLLDSSDDENDEVEIIEIL